MRIVLFFIVVLYSFQAVAQCDIIIEGKIIDEHSKAPIEDVYISILENDLIAISDAQGNFKIENICAGTYHFSYSHIGCEDHFSLLEIKKDTIVSVELEHDVHRFDDVTITAKVQHTHTKQVLNKQVIQDNGYKSFAETLENISGISTLKTGNNISKPIVEGLQGNRVVLLNNGIAQSGQQWGADHSPEIDPLSASKIEVIKGAETLEYPQSNRGEVVLIEPNKIKKNPKFNGKAMTFFESNGNMIATHARLNKYYKTLGWRLAGTYKKAGDLKAPHYYLTNTGLQEQNITFDLEKILSPKLNFNFHGSHYETTLGILRGAHISNEAQVEEAYTRTIPFFTNDKFSYDINAPKQNAKHTLVKTKLKYFHTNESWYEVVTSFQKNLRKEYDIRRGNRTSIPSLNINQYAFFLSGKYQKKWSNAHLNTGIQLNIIDNTNNPETGVLPLIPDYRSFETSAFAIYGRDISDYLKMNVGGRFDWLKRQALVIEGSVKKEVVEYNTSKPTMSLSTDFTYEKSGIKTMLQVAYLNRRPAINELYSYGLHQGVSGIEEGNVNLRNETSLKSTLSLVTTLHKSVELEAMVYYQRFSNYIYLQPLQDIRTTIRGAFQVFAYQQDQAEIMGLNVKSKVKLIDHLRLALEANFLEGNNLTQDIPLVDMPSNSLVFGLDYQKSINHSTIKKIETSLGYKRVFRQNHLLDNQNVARIPAPDGYGLLNYNLAVNTDIQGLDIRWIFNIENTLNTSYRDNLNRLRYFSDETGRNFVFGMQVGF